MDTNVDPASTMQVVNALIKANKDFDLLVIPGAGHGMGGAYGERKMNDFFVRNLLGASRRTGTGRLRSKLSRRKALDDDERNVVARLGAARVSLEVADDRAADVFGRRGPVLPHDGPEPAFGIVLARGVSSFGDAVGEKNGQVAGREARRADLIGRPGEHAQGESRVSRESASGRRRSK